MRFPVEIVLLLLLNSCDAQETCKLKTHFNNGFFSDSKTLYLVHTHANYRCKEGYATTTGKKEGFITCGQNGWLGEPTCIKICDIPQFVNVKQKGNKTFFKSKERLEYECMDGYETGNGQTTGFKICHNDEWPRVVECYEKTCSLPILHNMEPDLKKEKYKIGDVLTFRCFRGFKIAGPSSVQCYNFGWSPRLPTCKKQVNCCEQPPEILNGIAKDSKKKVYCHDDVVEYVCDLGFVMRGPRKIQCNDGEWTTLPTCIEEKRRCGEVPELVNGYIQTTDQSYSHGSLVEYDCVKNFKRVGKRTSTCLHGNWTQPPTCIEQDRLGRCSSKIFDGFQVNLNKEFDDIVINYKCNWNSEFKSTKCRNGRWSPPLNCSATKSCAPPPQIPNSQDMNITVNYEDGEKISVICKDNYLLHGQEEIICENGLWNSLPQCIEKVGKCGIPPPINNGDITTSPLSEYAPESRVEYICDRFHVLQGSQFVMCKNGKWTDPPTCLDHSCEYEPYIENAEVISKRKNRYKSGDVVSYRCTGSLKLYGKSDIICINKTWTDLPECKEEVEKCGIPPSIKNGNITTFPLPEYAPESRVEYRCEKFYYLWGSRFVTCKNGKWTHPPICIGIQLLYEED